MQGEREREIERMERKENKNRIEWKKRGKGWKKGGSGE
jgi:hypothetical protein